ncbi:hypothetical protein GCM10010317_097090 [Streptomyces mirabilis]|uniref:hypothetical protein n=1 Tax=Streptomyces mirabilis TaxID=68239 RepID=UPI00167CAF62|nr:hypothetical protein [Streptomyces mirabilis]GHD78173.1 hypothetical protein GCM10010317_097090 [Streptomyces mirabilis]
MPVFTLVVLALTLGGFAVTSFARLQPAWAALGGVLVLGGRRTTGTTPDGSPPAVRRHTCPQPSAATPAVEGATASAEVEERAGESQAQTGSGVREERAQHQGRTGQRHACLLYQRRGVRAQLASLFQVTPQAAAGLGR